MKKKTPCPGPLTGAGRGIEARARRFRGPGGRVTNTRWDWLIVSALGTCGILTSVSRASMVKCTNGARGVGSGASLMGVSVSPAISALGGLVG